jgi:GT2 family glycosyltransferase
MEPLISVKIPTYNCSDYLKETIISILNQKDFDLNLLEIEVVDDCSTNDNPELVTNEIGEGRINFFRQSKNIGAVENFNSCIERSNGKYIHILHGDDYISNNFYSEIKNYIEKNESIEAIFVRCFIVDETSQIITLSPNASNLNNNDFDSISEIFYSNPLRTPGVIVKRDFYIKNGGFDQKLIHVADWDMWIKIILNGKYKFFNNPIAYYRLFNGNETSKLSRTGENIIDTMRLFEKLICLIKNNFDQNRFLQMAINNSYNQYKYFKEQKSKIDSENNFKIFLDLVKYKYGKIRWIYIYIKIKIFKI